MRDECVHHIVITGYGACVRRSRVTGCSAAARMEQYDEFPCSAGMTRKFKKAPRLAKLLNDESKYACCFIINQIFKKIFYTERRFVSGGD